MKQKPRISDAEFRERILKTQSKMKEQGLDLLLAYANEAEPQYVRYYSDYWPSFELGAVLIPQEGEPFLLIGPESMTYAKSRSRIKEIRRILYLRESSEPDYPGSDLDSFESVIMETKNYKDIKRVGIAGYGLISKIVYDAFSKSLDKLGIESIEKSDQLVNDLRIIKSKDEIECLRYAYSIADYAMEKVVDNIKPGMTENQVKGIAVAAMFEKGAEAEGYPFWILTGKGSNQAVSRIRDKVIEEGDLVQVQVAARYEGYVSTLGRPIVIGNATDEQKNLINAGYTVEKEIFKIAKPGLPAKAISDLHKSVLTKLGYDDHILYGPVHGTGLMENEHPWIEEHSNYDIQEGMTFCTCLYLGNDATEVGIRVENGFLITKDGVEILGKFPSEYINVK